MIFAEVIGDPIARSKSPVIHRYWLERLGIKADYVRTRVASGELPNFLERRRADPDWRGCNVTMPHKQAILTSIERLDPGAKAIGAVNCVVPEDGALVGYNSDIDGVAAALDCTDLRSRKVVLIGAGGAARAVLAHLADRRVGSITIIARNPLQADALRALVPEVGVDALPFEKAGPAFDGAVAIINASPLGMTAADPMPQSILEAVRSHASGSTIFDLVTTPVETELLAAGGTAGGKTVDGLAMLVGQARRAFELFYGAPAPPPDSSLRDLLVTGRRVSA